MSDALPLPPRSSLEHYKKRAKQLVKLLRSGDRGELRAWLTEWVETLAQLYKLEIAFPREVDAEERRLDIERTAGRVFKRLDAIDPSSCTLAQAQFAIAREHGFASWTKFTHHIEGLARRQSEVSEFEAAVAAIVTGNLEALDSLLRTNPELAKARSMREHRSTLLHYVSANGVEDFRQKTPKNIVEIAKRLLDAGADVNAESDAYGGRSTTLGLTATSYHPEAAGVQIPLMELLIDRGARLEDADRQSIVNTCLHNGRGRAAEFLAARGARLDLEGAGGVGRLDFVQTFFEANGRLKPSAAFQQMKDGLAWACEFGRTEVVRFLLEADQRSGSRISQSGHDGLHWAAFSANLDLVTLLLQHGTPVDAKDERHHGTPLGWALYGWHNPPSAIRPLEYYKVVALLVQSGATPDPAWFEAVPNHLGAPNKIQSDPRMLAALRGEI
jgi:ankyrin repeat protein